MKNKLSCIMLVDDDEDDNFFHQMVLKEADVALNVQVAENGFDALKVLQNGILTPQLIFLDINMPRMNGWEFLNEYRKLDMHQKAKVIIIMLTTSLNPADRAMAKKIPEINGFKNKPLTVKMLEDVIQNFFSEINTGPTTSSQTHNETGQ